MSNLKDTNPKEIFASTKLPLHLWPTTATALGCLGLMEGGLKYGAQNFRDSGIRASVYYTALLGHMAAWWETEELTPDAGLPHLANALANLAIIVDAIATGTFVDDRAYRGHNYRNFVDNLRQFVPQLQAQFGDRNPKHFTAADNEIMAAPTTKPKRRKS